MNEENKVFIISLVSLQFGVSTNEATKAFEQKNIEIDGVPTTQTEFESKELDGKEIVLDLGMNQYRFVYRHREE